MKLQTLRPWQSECLVKARDWFIEREKDLFLINAAPGAGKTIAACAIAASLIDDGLVDRVIVVAPRSEVVSQWAADFERITGRFMDKITPADSTLATLGHDLCVTWSALQGLEETWKRVCSDESVLLICDEHHHAAAERSWGLSADSGLASARFTLLLTGTPLRSDGEASIWMDYDKFGALSMADAQSFTLSYGDAVELGYCRPATFHRHEGNFKVDAGDGQLFDVNSKSAPELSPELKRISGLERALDFYKLACTPQYESDGQSPLLAGFQASMLQFAALKLDEIREDLPDAGGLVIAPNIEMAEYMASLIEMIEGEPAVVVHSQQGGSSTKIKAFRRGSARWLVSVAMVSEGVDISRLRLLVYLPYATTELAFRQAVGRVVRSAGNDDFSRAYIVMPCLEKFDAFARRIEEEIPPSAAPEQSRRTSKICPVCESECERNATECAFCGYEFPVSPSRMKDCSECGASNLLSADACCECGASFLSTFQISLREALRDGAIVRGIEVSEKDVREGEAIAGVVRREALRSGDERIVELIKKLPEESWGRLKAIING